jgi:photosystem II stability/assembly factor-like uncharacterized protein
VSAVSESVVWASGSGGTFLRTTDGGANWKAGKIPGASDVDFRAIHGFDENNAIMMSAGNGEKSRIYKTRDGGASWRLVYTNPDPMGFFDGIAFWDERHGILLGDPINGRFEIMTTEDGGENWKSQKGPGALPMEGAFAASNSSLCVRGAREVWFGSGGPKAARVFHSTDGGETWSIAKTPVRNDGPSAGIFSIAFANGKLGMAAGGDYSKPDDASGNLAMTADGGKTWTAAGSPNGFRSDVKYVAERKIWIVTGTSGTDVSADDGKSWKAVGGQGYNAMSFAGSSGWAVGPKGAIGKLTL